MIELIVEKIIFLISNLGYPIVFFLMFLDALNIPAASEITLTFSGFLAKSGRFDFWPLILTAFLGNLLGGVTNYFIGRLGQKLFLSEQKIEKGRKFIVRHFNYAPFVANILPLLRSFIALPLGLLKYPFRKFIWQAAVAYFTWAILFAGFGFLLADKWQEILPYFKILDFIAVGVIIGIIIYAFKHKKDRNS